MGEFLSYSIMSGLLMLFMFSAYKLFLARDNQHGYNRIILLLIYLVSFASLPVVTFFKSLNFSTSSDTIVMNGVVEAISVNQDRPLWGTVLIWIFISGMVIMTVKTIVIWIRLIRVIRSGEKVKKDGCTLVVTDDERFAPFSWMHYVVISTRDNDDNNSAIITHELEHISRHHWVDLLVAQIVCVVNWFNPAAWLMREELMLVHEYQADMAVIDSGHNPQQYQMLLIKKAVGARFPSLANSLNHSKLKKRITMMYKEKSCAGHRFKALALVPMLALAFGVAAVPAVRAAMSTISSSDVTVSKGSENKPMDKTTIKIFRLKNLNNNGNQTSVTISGENLGSNLTVTGGTLTTAGKTYQAKSMQCSMKNGSAVIVVTFPFMSEFENSSLTLNINGEEIPFDLDNFLDKADSIKIKPAGQDNGDDMETIVIKGNSSSSGLGNMIVYFDGKKISYDDMKEISPAEIGSMSIDKNSNTIIITRKK